MTVQITELLGKRVLVRPAEATPYGRTGRVEEVRVLEISPSGEWVRLMNAYGSKYWRPVVGLDLVEELVEIKPKEPKPPEDRIRT